MYNMKSSLELSAMRSASEVSRMAVASAGIAPNGMEATYFQSRAKT